MATHKLTDDKETLFIPLFGKAIDYRSKKSILNDKMASDIVEKMNVDLSKYDRFGERISAVRAKQYDKWTKVFITKNNNAVVVHLGCGLDARIIRTQPPSSIHWFDVDYPDVVSLRKQFYSETNAYKMIASSITAPDWLETIPADRPTFIIAEGVFEYLSEEDVKTLLHRLTSYFSHGQIVFDVMNSFAIKSGNKNLEKTTGAISILKWAVDNINAVDQLNAKLKRVEVVPLFNSIFIKKLPFGFRFIFRLLRLSSKLKNGFRLLRYNF